MSVKNARVDHSSCGGSMMAHSTNENMTNDEIASQIEVNNIFRRKRLRCRVLDFEVGFLVRRVNHTCMAPTTLTSSSVNALCNALFSSTPSKQLVLTILRPNSQVNVCV